jgi:hypothetical protein
MPDPHRTATSSISLRSSSLCRFSCPSQRRQPIDRVPAPDPKPRCRRTPVRQPSPTTTELASLFSTPLLADARQRCSETATVSREGSPKTRQPAFGRGLCATKASCLFWQVWADFRPVRLSKLSCALCRPACSSRSTASWRAASHRLLRSGGCRCCGECP